MHLCLAAVPLWDLLFDAQVHGGGLSDVQVDCCFDLFCHCVIWEQVIQVPLSKQPVSYKVRQTAPPPAAVLVNSGYWVKSFSHTCSANTA